MRRYLVFIFCSLAFAKSPFGLVGRVSSSVSRGLEIRAIAEGWTYAPPMQDYATGLKDRSFGKKDQSYVDLSKADVEIPDEFDPRDKLGPIRNQGSCGSCWAFSITASLRDALMVKGLKDPGALGEQYLVDCARDMYGCGGGLPEAAKWVVTPYGAPSESDYPYRARNGSCMKKPIAGQGIEWQYVGKSGTLPVVSDIQKAILLYSSASVTIAADNALAGYRGGVFRGGARSINHMTNIVGWSKTGGYWIMRNSWGTNWGENGWGKIAYGANSIGTDTIIIKVIEQPPVPIVREFTIEGTSLSVKVTLKAQNKGKTEDAKRLVSGFVTDLDSRSK